MNTERLIPIDPPENHRIDELTLDESADLQKSDCISRFEQQRTGLKALVIELQETFSQKDKSVDFTAIERRIIHEKISLLEINIPREYSVRPRDFFFFCKKIELSLTQQIGLTKKTVDEFSAEILQSSEMQERVELIELSREKYVLDLLNNVESSSLDADLSALARAIVVLATGLSDPQVKRATHHQNIAACEQKIAGEKIGLASILGESTFKALRNRLDKPGHTKPTYELAIDDLRRAVLSPRTALTMLYCANYLAYKADSSSVETQLPKLKKSLKTIPHDADYLSLLLDLPLILDTAQHDNIEHDSPDKKTDSNQALAYYLRDSILYRNMDPVSARELWFDLGTSPVETVIYTYLDSLSSTFLPQEADEGKKDASISYKEKKQKDLVKKLQRAIGLAAVSVLLLGVVRNSGAIKLNKAPILDSNYVTDLLSSMTELPSRFLSSKILNILEAASLSSKFAEISAAQEAIILEQIQTLKQDMQSPTSTANRRFELSNSFAESISPISEADLAHVSNNLQVAESHAFDMNGNEVRTHYQSSKQVVWQMNYWDYFPEALILVSNENISLVNGEMVSKQDVSSGSLLQIPTLDHLDITQSNILFGEISSISNEWQTLPHPPNTTPTAGVIVIKQSNFEIPIPIEISLTDGGTDQFFRVASGFDIGQVYNSATPATLTVYFQFNQQNNVENYNSPETLVGAHEPLLPFDQLPTDLQQFFEEINNSSLSDEGKIASFTAWFNTYGIYSLNSADNQMAYVQQAIARGDIDSSLQMQAWLQTFFHGAGYGPIGLGDSEFPRVGAGECFRRNIAGWSVIPYLQLERNWQFELERALMLDLPLYQGENNTSSVIRQSQTHLRLVAVNMNSGKRVYADVTQALSTDESTSAVIDAGNSLELPERQANSTLIMQGGDSQYAISLRHSGEYVRSHEFEHPLEIKPIVLDINEMEYEWDKLEEQNVDLFTSNHIPLVSAKFPWQLSSVNSSSVAVRELIAHTINENNELGALFSFDADVSGYLTESGAADRVDHADYTLKILQPTNVVPLYGYNPNRLISRESVKVFVHGEEVPFELVAERPAPPFGAVNVMLFPIYARIDVPAKSLVGQDVRIVYDSFEGSSFDFDEISWEIYQEQYSDTKARFQELGFSENEVTQLLLRKLEYRVSDEVDIDEAMTFFASDPDMNLQAAFLSVRYLIINQGRMEELIEKADAYIPNMLKDLAMVQPNFVLDVRGGNIFIDQEAEIYISVTTAVNERLSQGEYVSFLELYQLYSESELPEFKIAWLIDNFLSRYAQYNLSRNIPATPRTTMNAPSLAGYEMCSDLSADPASLLSCLNESPHISYLENDYLKTWIYEYGYFGREAIPNLGFLMASPDGLRMSSSSHYSLKSFLMGNPEVLTLDFGLFLDKEVIINGLEQVENDMNKFYVDQVVAGFMQGNPIVWGRFLVLYLPLVFATQTAVNVLAHKRRYQKRRTLNDFIRTPGATNTAQAEIYSLITSLGLPEMPKSNQDLLIKAWGAEQSFSQKHVFWRKWLTLQGSSRDGSMAQPYHLRWLLINSEYRNQHKQSVPFKSKEVPPTYIMHVKTFQLDAYADLLSNGDQNAYESLQILLEMLAKVGVAFDRNKNNYVIKDFEENLLIISDYEKWKLQVRQIIWSESKYLGIEVGLEAVDLVINELFRIWTSILSDYREYHSLI
ncbi:MAG: hypothetical protein WAU07_04995 [Microgenomates group bacterium]